MSTQAPDQFTQAQAAVNQMPQMIAPFIQAAQQVAGQVAQQSGQQFGKGAVQGAQQEAVSNGTLAAIGVGGIALLGLVGYAGYMTGKKSPAMASGEYGYAGLDLYDMGHKMMNWHGGQFDPVYMVASFFVNGEEYPDLEVVDRAKTRLEIILENYGTSRTTDDLGELSEVCSGLAAYLREREYTEPAFASDDETKTRLMKTQVMTRARSPMTMEHRLPTAENPYWQSRPLQYEGQRWPKQYGYQIPVHDYRTQRVAGLALEEPPLSTGAKVALGLGVVATGTLAWFLIS